MKRVQVKITEGEDWEYIKLANFFMPDKEDVLPDKRPFIAMKMTDGRIYDKLTDKWYDNDAVYNPEIKDNVKVVIEDPELSILPYANEVAIEVVANFVLHKVTKLIPLMKEISRILKPNACLIVRVPCFPHLDAVSDPETVHYFTQHTFEYFVDKYNLFKHINQHIEGTTLVVKLRK